ncbi:MAG TPA: GNAT family N-acetyltransferase [Baekduia sp.]|nr:GNAT family N-acetyltransferase [Baekduia sp.]
MPSTARRIEIITDPRRFAEVAPAWDRLEAIEPTPFSSHGWFDAWWRAFGSGTLHVVVLWDGDELAGALPLSREGNQLRALAGVHTPLFRPLAVDHAAMDVLLGTVCEGVSRLTLEALPVGEPAEQSLARSVRAIGGRVLQRHAHTSPNVDTSGSFEAWRELSRSSWGAPLERFRRKMIREHETTIETIVTPVDLEQELHAGFEVEASGWKGRHGTAILSSPVTTQFYRDVARLSHARGELRLSRILLDGAIAAFDLTLLRQGRLYLLKTGYDERHRRLAPGLVMRLSIIERCFEAGILAHDLLGDDAEWKRKFATCDRRHATLEVYGPSPGLLARYAWRGVVLPPLTALPRRGVAGARVAARYIATRGRG